ncbi:MAG: hypothetical protein ACRDJO_13055 [Actinomycetota bacterium]
MTQPRGGRFAHGGAGGRDPDTGTPQRSGEGTLSRLTASGHAAGLEANASFLEWGVAESWVAGVEDPRARYLVTETQGGALLAVVYGLGPRPVADKAARIAIEVLRDRAGEPIWCLMERCHTGLAQTQGAAMTLAEILWSGGTLTWGGIGNVRGQVVRSTSGRGEIARRLAGVVGFILPHLEASTTRLAGGDVVILANDGVAPGFADNVLIDGHPRSIASRILRRQARRRNALVLAARFLGP